MSTTVAEPIASRDMLGTAAWVLLLAIGVLYAVAFDQGVLQAPITEALLSHGGLLHETFHDARHLLGVPCH